MNTYQTIIKKAINQICSFGKTSQSCLLSNTNEQRKLGDGSGKYALAQ